MKTDKRFILLFTAVICACCVLCAVCCAFSLAALRQSTNEAVTKVLANVTENYPDIGETELMKIINGKAGTEGAGQMLKAYGIRDGGWVISQNLNDSAAVMGVSIAACAFCGVSCLAAFFIYRRREKMTAERLTSYLEQINRGNYNLDLTRNNEDITSVLQNEIYKTTVMLRESAQSSKKGRENLKTSLSDISHQLKTPLTSISIMTENLLDNPDMPVELRSEFLSDIYRAATHINALVQSLLTLSKLDADSIAFKNQDVLVSELFDAVIKNLAVAAELNNAELTAEDNGAALICDKKWVSEALTNIAKNCIEHSPDGRVELFASSNPLYTEIIISDNGKGIDKQDLPRIFERFYKGKNSGENSAGIGLALSKAIIEKSGGIISVDSNLGEGTKFTVKFFNGVNK